jgi:hypothetical protein
MPLCMSALSSEPNVARDIILGQRSVLLSGAVVPHGKVGIA